MLECVTLQWQYDIMYGMVMDSYVGWARACSPLTSGTGWSSSGEAWSDCGVEKEFIFHVAVTMFKRIVINENKALSFNFQLFTVSYFE